MSTTLLGVVHLWFSW